MSGDAGTVALVVLTHNRRREVLRTLERLAALAEPLEICVVDNASSDGSGDAIARAFPAVRLLRLARNFGAAGRNAGVRAVRARHVAFCDDDAWWAPGSLARAAALLDAHPRLAALTARILVGPGEREDPTSALMAASPLRDCLGVPGVTAVAGCMAGACVMRRQAFLAVGGYEPRFFIGGEERLLAIDLLAAGWHLGYCPELVVHHHPSPSRDAPGRRRLLLRNALWCAWLRRPCAGAWRETWRRLAAAGEGESLAGLGAALLGMPWVLRHRRVVPARVESLLSQLDGEAG